MKKRTKKNIKRNYKNKDKNINIKINIDQSKKGGFTRKKLNKLNSGYSFSNYPIYTEPISRGINTTIITPPQLNTNQNDDKNFELLNNTLKTNIDNIKDNFNNLLEYDRTQRIDFINNLKQQQEENKRIYENQNQLQRGYIKTELLKHKDNLNNLLENDKTQRIDFINNLKQEQNNLLENFSNNLINQIVKLDEPKQSNNLFLNQPENQPEIIEQQKDNNDNDLLPQTLDFKSINPKTLSDIINTNKSLKDFEKLYKDVKKDISNKTIKDLEKEYNFLDKIVNNQNRTTKLKNPGLLQIQIKKLNDKISRNEMEQMFKEDTKQKNNILNNIEKTKNNIISINDNILNKNNELDERFKLLTNQLSTNFK